MAAYGVLTRQDNWHNVGFMFLIIRETIGGQVISDTGTRYSMNEIQVFVD